METPLPGDARLLRIFLGEGDRHGGKPLYEAIVLRAREMGLAGATVLRGPMGYGAHSRLHTTRLLRLSEDLPMVVEIVDEAEKIERFTVEAAEMLQGGLVTVERVQVLHYRPHHDKDRA
jgi:PII-like signaling protein